VAGLPPSRQIGSVRIFIASAVFILMLSIGMSVRLPELLHNWRQLKAQDWTRLFLATFIVPPFIALALGQILPLSLPLIGGLFLVATAPGAPLLTRNIAKRGFDAGLGASYQVWGALMLPIMVPLLVVAAANLYSRDIWIPPLTILSIIFKQQFVPLLLGMALVQFAPQFSGKVQLPLNVLANLVFIVAVIALLWALGPALKQITPWLFVAVLVLAVGSMAATYGLLHQRSAGIATLVMSNVNRNAGLALLLSEPFFRDGKEAVPAIACYALAAPILMAVYGRLGRSAAG